MKLKPLQERLGFTLLIQSDPADEHNILEEAEISLNEGCSFIVSQYGELFISHKVEDRIHDVFIGQVNSIEQVVYVYKVMHSINTNGKMFIEKNK